MKKTLLYMIKLIIYFTNILSCELNNHDQKNQRTPARDLRKHKTAISTLSGLIRSVYRDLHHKEIEPATTVCTAETLPLSSLSTSRIGGCPRGVMVKRVGLRNRSTRVRTPVALLRSLSGKYPWERYEPPYPPSYALNSTTTVLQGQWLWH